MKRYVCFLGVMLATLLLGSVVFADDSLDAALNVDGGSLTFVTCEAYPWEVTELDGHLCAKSGNSGVDGSVSDISLSVYLDAGQGISFEWNADTEVTTTLIAMWDYMLFCVDGSYEAHINSYENAGPTGWQKYEWTAEESGMYVFEWSYNKDSSTSQGEDCGYLDNVKIIGSPIESPEPTPTPEPGVEYIVYEESFDESPEDWWNDDFDGDGNYWEWGTEYGHENAGAIYSYSWSAYGGPLTPDNQACTPEFDLSEDITDAKLSFWLYSMDDEYCNEHVLVQLVRIYENLYGLYDIEFIADLASITLQNGEWNEYTVDLTEYAGYEGVSIAFVHCNSTDQYGVVLDEVAITAVNGGEPLPLGDVDFDGAITPNDALAILRHALDIMPMDENALSVADINNDGAVTTADALALLRISLGIGSSMNSLL